MTTSTGTKKRLSPSVYYLLIGTAVGWPSLLGVSRLLPLWQQGRSGTPDSLAAIHLLVLGSMLTVAWGVLYQIVPIAFQAPPVPRHLLYWHLPLHLLSVVGMVIGFLTSQFLVVGSFGSLLFCSATGFFVFAFKSYRRARNKTAVHRALIFPLAALGLVMLIGIDQALLPASVSSSLLLTHVLLGGMAFWGTLVLVLSYKLVPMFSLSHGYTVSIWRTVSLYAAGVLLWILSSWIPSYSVHRVGTAVAFMLVAAGSLLYVVDMMTIVRARKRKRIVLPMFDAFLAMLLLVFGQLGTVVSSFFHLTTGLFASVFLFVFGGLLALMLSYMQKMVPFLWFEYRFSKRPERKTAPLIDDMVAKTPAQSGMLIYYLGVFTGVVALFTANGSGLVTLSWCSGVAMTTGSALVFFALRHVLTIGGIRPSDGPTE
ncbi:hypothetical protein [Alicyclobacillus sp. ALC3]|uniref:hypothetical protein n=1 Tax=Alicyclobacillus sp. ALC3 TaxID=2796143 RepID=UPI00237901BC|nr:hypothetical protein [Alicyclobacillus sp. ALC3]WDL97568.1 hypothetical protein JC200_02230 [Alicyclobacillus sp. ALC3]